MSELLKWSCQSRDMSLYLWAAQSNLNQHARGFVRGQVCSGVRRGFLFRQLVELECGREVQTRNKNNQFWKSFLFMWTAGRGKGAGGTKSHSSKSGAVPGWGSPQVIPSCPGSVQQQSVCIRAEALICTAASAMSWGFSVDAPMISSEAQLHADLWLWEMVRAVQVKAETTRMTPKCPTRLVVPS